MLSRLSVMLLALVIAVSGTGRAHAQDAQDAKDATPAAEIETAPVVFDGQTLLRVRGVTSLPAAERARLIRDRLTLVAANPAIPVDALRVVEGAGLTKIVGGDRTVMNLFDADAAIEQVDRSELAAVHLQRFRQAVRDYRADRAPVAIRHNALVSGVASVVLAITMIALTVFWRWVDRLFERRLERRIHSLGIQQFEVLRAEQVARVLHSTLTTVRTGLFLALVLVYVGYVLSKWPRTRGVSASMSEFALAPVLVIGRGLATHLPHVVFLVVLAYLIRVVLRFVRLFFDAVARGDVTMSGFDTDWAEPTYKIVRVAIIAFGLVVAFPYIPGSDTAAFRGVTVFIGIVFSLGSSTAIANIIAGYMMTYRRAFRVGDRVRIGDAYGDVLEVRLQVTHLRSVKNEEFVVPNSQILSGQVMNYSSLARKHGLILHTEVGIGYETPWRQVEAMLRTAADRTAGLKKDPAPFILLKALGDFAVTYELNVHSDNVHSMGALYAELHRNILDLFNEYGVQIMTPAYEGDPEVPKVVAAKDWYAPPAARPPASTDRRAS